MDFHPLQTGFRSQFFRLAAVNVLSNIMVPLAGLVDVAFLGHLSEIRHLAGVALATVLFNYIYWTFGFLRMGTTGITAQALGRGNHDDVWLTGVRNGLLAIAIGLLILLLQHPLRELGFKLLSATPEVKASGLAYYNALIWGAPATLLNFVLIGWFLGKGHGAKVLVLSLASNGTNVILNYLFIVKWGWASAGAGWGTGLSQYLMALVGLGMVSRERGLRWGAIAPHLLNPSALKAAFVLNSDILIRTFALVSTFALFTNLSAANGTTVLATNTLLLQILTLSAYFIDGLAFATESFAGLFRGQRQSQHLLKLIQLSGSVSLALGIAFALTTAMFSMPIFSLLTNHANVVAQVQIYVVWLLPILGFGAIAYMLDGYFLGLTEGRILRTSSLIASLVGFAPLAAIAWSVHSNHLLWLAMTGFMAARAITLGWQVPKTLKN
jgi:multidrug resistance protein, MATE family